MFDFNNQTNVILQKCHPATFEQSYTLCSSHLRVAFNWSTLEMWLSFKKNKKKTFMQTQLLIHSPVYSPSDTLFSF